MRVVKLNGKPFESGQKVNTTKGKAVRHPATMRWSWRFNEDDSVVEARMCRPADDDDMPVSLRRDEEKQ